MKRFSSVVAVLALVASLCLTCPVAAASLGVSPSHIDIVIPVGASTQVEFDVHYFSGALRVSTVDIPVTVTGSGIFNITESPSRIIVTLQDASVGPSEYNGLIRFASIGGSVTLAVSIRARVVVQLRAVVVSPLVLGDGSNGGVAPVATSTPEPPSIIVSASQGNETVSLSIPQTTVIIKADGSPVNAADVTVTPIIGTVDLPDDMSIIGLAYDFEPSGALFDPPIILTFAYDESLVPEGVAEDDLIVAFFDIASGTWVELECRVDPVTHIITASVSHFTVFAVLCRSSIPQDIPIVTPTPSSVPSATTPVISPTTIPETPVNPVSTSFPLGWILWGVGLVILVTVIIYSVSKRRHNSKNRDEEG